MEKEDNFDRELKVFGDTLQWIFRPYEDTPVLKVLYKGFHLGDQRRRQEEVEKALGEKKTKELIKDGYLEKDELGFLRIGGLADYSMDFIGNIAFFVKHHEYPPSYLNSGSYSELRAMLEKTGLLELPDHLLQSYEPVEDLAKVEGRDVKSSRYLRFVAMETEIPNLSSLFE